MRTKSGVFQRLAGQRGAGLIEAIVAIAVLAVVMSTLLTGLSSFNISAGKNKVQSMAENIVRNQMEYVFEQSYLQPMATYNTIALPQSFGVAVEALEYVAGDPNVEKVRVTVYHQGQQTLVVETLRSNY